MEKAQRKSSLQLIHEKNFTTESERHDQEKELGSPNYKVTSEKEENVSQINTRF